MSKTIKFLAKSEINTKKLTKREIINVKKSKILKNIDKINV